MDGSITRADDWADCSGDVFFSFVDGFVWASWPGGSQMVKVGRYDAATAAMRDFLAQCELGDRLANGVSKFAPSPHVGRTQDEECRPSA